MGGFGKRIYRNYVIDDHWNIRMTPQSMSQSARALLVAVLVLSMLPAGSMLQFQTADSDRATIQAIEYNATIVVTVTDDMGRAIGGALVQLVGTTLSNQTNISGMTAFTGLMADTVGTSYNVSAQKIGYTPSGVLEVVATPGNASSITLTIYGGSILGTVSYSMGPIVGAMVSISSLGYSNVTDSLGHYRLDGVPGNTFPYALTASAQGYVNKTNDVYLSTGGVTQSDFVLTSLTGSISGTVRDSETAEPLAGATVSVIVGTVTVTATTNADGTYRIPNLDAGLYSLNASLEGFASVTTSNIVVESGVHTTDIDFQLTEKPTRLYGVVKAGTFLIPGVLITIVGTGFMTNSSIDGEYEILNLTAGTYTVVASREGYNTNTTSVTITRGGEKLLNIALQGLPGSLSGKVISSETGQPISGIKITITSHIIQRETVTNIYGEFEFTGMNAGNYTVTFVLEGYKSKELGPIKLTQNETTKLDQVIMEPASESFGGFIFGFDLAHSMMILALFLTIIILALAVILRIRAFETPDNAPAVYDEQDEEPESEKEKLDETVDSEIDKTEIEG